MLEGDDGHVHSTKDMLDVTTSFYKKLFAYEPKPNIHLGGHFWSDGELVTEIENELLEKHFSKEKMKEAIMGSYASGAPNPDGLSFPFYETFWDLIKGDSMALVMILHRVSLTFVG